MLRVIALISTWSHDYWIDVNHQDIEMRTADAGPSDHEFLLVSTNSQRPSEERLKAMIAALRAEYLPDYDGHAELHSCAVLDDPAWEAFTAVARWPVKTGIESVPGRPAIVNDLLEFEQAMAMWRSAKVQIEPLERHGLPHDAPALNHREQPSVTDRPQSSDKLPGSAIS